MVTISGQQFTAALHETHHVRSDPVPRGLMPQFFQFLDHAHASVLLRGLTARRTRRFVSGCRRGRRRGRGRCRAARRTRDWCM